MWPRTMLDAALQQSWPDLQQSCSKALQDLSAPTCLLTRPAVLWVAGRQAGGGTRRPSAKFENGSRHKAGLGCLAPPPPCLPAPQSAAGRASRQVMQAL